MKLKKTACLVTSLLMGVSCFNLPNNHIKAIETAEGQEVLYAAFDGDTTDSSSYENDGKAVGDISYVKGIKGKALHIYNENGSSNEKAKQYVNFGQDASLKFGSDDFSLTYWYRSDNGVSDGGAFISNKNWNSGGNAGLTIGDFNNGLRVNFTAEGSSRRDLYDIAPIDGVWHKVTVNFDRDGNMSSYLDGKLRKSGSIAADKGKSIDVNDFIIGADGFGKYGLNDAYIDELHVVKGLISEQSIQNEFLKDKITYEINSKRDAVNDAKQNSKFDADKIEALEASIREAEKLITSNDYDAIMSAVADLDIKLNSLYEGVEDVISGQMMYASFDEENVNDETGRDNHGVPTGDISYVDGVIGKAVHIVNENGSTAGKAQSFINFGQGDDLQFGSEDFAFGFWYKSEKGGASEGALMSNKDWASGGNPGYAIGNFSNGLRMNFTADGAGRKDIYNIGANNDDWHYVVINVDRNAKMKAYVDNALVNETAIDDVKGKSINVGDFVIGADGLKNNGVDNVYLDEVRVFKRLMSDQERAQFYYPSKLNMNLNEVDRAIEKAKEEGVVSQGKIDELESVAIDIRSKMNGATDQEMQAMIRRLAMAYDRFLMSEEKNDLTFNVLSDVHIEGTDPKAVTNANFIDALEDIAVLNPDSAALIVPGDITNGGSADQYKGFFDIVDNYSTAEPVVALGNHDVRWLCSSEDRNEAGVRIPTCKPGTNPFAERYLSRNQKYMDDAPEGQLYFDKWIDGYHFITLNTEADLKDQSYISQEQLAWLEETLAEGADPNKPIFLQVHQTLSGTADHEELDVVGGEEEEQLKAILSKYPQSIIFTGHVHNGVDLADVYQGTWGHLVDVPCFWYSSYGSSQAQVGYQINVNGTKVEVKFRDYKNDKWMDEYTKTFDIHDPIPADPADDSKDISLDGITASAGSEQSTTGSEGPAKNVLDNDTDTIWHTKWGGVSADLLNITLNLPESTKIDGLRYLPRSNAGNGTIKNYEIYVSNDFGKTYELALSSTWKANATWKIASFAPRYATNVKLVGIETVGEMYASAAEIRITAPKETSDSTLAKEILQGSIDKAKIAVASAQFKTLAPKVQNLITTRLGEAEAVIANDTAGDQAYLTAWYNLANALQYMDFKADKTDLKTLIELCKTLNKDDYEVGYDEFKKVLDEAEVVYKNENVLQDTIQKAYQSLSDAKDALIKAGQADKPVLERIITDIMAVVQDGEGYHKDANWDAYQEALQHASSVLANADATKVEIKEAIMQLTNAYENLRLLPDENKLKALEALIEKVASLQAQDYVVEDYQFMLSVAGRARLLLEDFDDVKYNELQADMAKVWEISQAGMIETPDEPTTSQPDASIPVTPNASSNPEKTKTPSSENRNGTVKPGTTKTGDSTNVPMAFTLLVLGAGAMYMMRKRNKDN